MKKSKLRNIIRKTIKEFHDPTHNPTHMHIYQGCNLQSGPNQGVGNHWGLSPQYDGFAANIMWNNPNNVGNVVGLMGAAQAGSLEASLINNSSLIHDWFGSPQIGEVVRFISCPNINICIPSCLKYLGTETSLSNGNYQGVAWSHDNDSGRSIHPDCNSCGNVTTPTYDCDPNTNTCSDPGNGMGQYSGNINGQGALADCQAACVAPPSGCMDQNAFNYDPNATIDDGSCDYGYICESTWFIQTGKRDKDIGKECIPGNAQNPGTFETLQECNESCGPRRAPDDKSSNFVNPITSDPQSKVTEPDDEITRMQKLANIDK